MRIIRCSDAAVVVTNNCYEPGGMGRTILTALQAPGQSTALGAHIPTQPPTGMKIEMVEIRIHTCTSGCGGDRDITSEANASVHLQYGNKCVQLSIGQQLLIDSWSQHTQISIGSLCWRDPWASTQRVHALRREWLLSLLIFIDATQRK